MSYNVVLVDDEKMVLNSLALAFNWSATDFNVIATFQSSQEALEQILILKPEVVFTDIRMPEMDGLQLMEKVLKKQPQIKFVIISGYEDFSYAKKALTLGAVGYCVKPLEDEEILALLGQIHSSIQEGERYFNTLFHSMLYKPVSENISRFTNYLLHVKGCEPEVTIAASIRDMSSEFDGYVHYYKLQCETDTYLYIIENYDFLNSIGFTRRIKQLLLKEQIINFCYIPATLNDNFYNQTKELLDCIYSYYLTPIDITKSNFLVSQEKPKTEYIDLLNTEASKNEVRNVLSLLKNYPTLYPAPERTIHDVIKIFHITVSLLQRLDHSYPEEPIYTPSDLIKKFPEIDSVFQHLIQHLSKTYSSNILINMDLIKNDTMKKILEYINRNFTSALSFQDICKTYTINPSYLSQVFKRELGTTFTNYIKDLRIHYAMELLVKTNEPISIICEKIGYDQYFYFSKLFKRETGLSPSQYREKEQKHQNKRDSI
ncbi:response regulator [Anaerocolumna xylanovorans]|uniref:Stage 0 sporulation protein A homolog n=1 Tax=Anaerocolumna xylanovorans DSM 12503 TaxID=1121345 RepID=A0A1M7XXR3_9FIRM|nr:response regulator [Anaerocolumna xylanovorans]SHO43764.1 Two-component response regulator, YesN/AraC family, consists of REC and AraC-type DNA-binding domains [Anaerocolumna xylanovorans DSM 12503]